MKLFELSQLSFKERFAYVNENNIENLPDIKIVKTIFEDTIQWFQKPTNQRDLNLSSKLRDTKSVLPSFFNTIYEIKEKSIIKNLSSNFLTITKKLGINSILILKEFL